MTVTFSGSAAFTSATSYVCTANGTTGAATSDGIINVVQNSGTSVTFWNSNNGFQGTSDAINYVCIGH